MNNKGAFALQAFLKIAPSANHSNDPVLSDETVPVNSGALCQILRTVGHLPSEAGGLLVGPMDEDRITDFIFDSNAATTCASYSPSHEHLSRMCETVAERGFDLKGFCHSHPPGFGRPSRGDLAYVQKFFQANPTLEKFYLPILPEVALPRAQISQIISTQAWNAWIRCFVVYRSRPDEFLRATIQAGDGKHLGTCESFPIAKKDEIGSPLPFNASVLQNELKDVRIQAQETIVDGFSIPSILLTRGECSVILLVPKEFPLFGPIVLQVPSGGLTKQFPTCWDLESTEPPVKRLAKLINDALKISQDHY